MPVILFHFDLCSLIRSRSLEIVEGKNGYAIPNTPAYLPLRNFLTRKKGKYPFRMLELLHVAGVKMMAGRVLSSDFGSSLCASAGLYLALDQSHPDICFNRNFGDFTSGFSHQFGVALACMSLSEAFSVPWDWMVPIPVKGKKVLDYEVKVGSGKWLRFEAKGISTNNRSKARRDIANKKKGITAPAQSKDTAMIGVIAQAANPQSKGVIEFVDPSFEENPAFRREENQIAGRMLHYATLAAFAGLTVEARRIRLQALARLGDVTYETDGASIDLYQPTLEIVDRSIAGVQWRVGDSPGTDVWFVQGVDYDIIRNVISDGSFPDTNPYSTAERDTNSFISNRDDGLLLYSMTSDGSFFGISTRRLESLRVLESQVG